MSDDTVSGYVPRTFSDAGTGETFEGGKSHSFAPGAHANYKAAGLIGEPPAEVSTNTAPEIKAPAKGKR